MDGERGQATLEYVLVVALVAVLIGAAITAVNPGAIVNAVVGQYRHALCLVGGSACTADRPKPCVLRSEGSRRSLALSIAVIRVDDDQLLLREQLSDGKVRLTLMRDGGIGGELEVALKGQLRLKSLNLSVGGQAAATLQAIYGDGKVFVVDSDEEADRIQDRLKRGLPVLVDKMLRVVGFGGDDGLDPDIRYQHGGAKASLKASLDDPRGASAEVEAVGANVIGMRTEGRTGKRTYFLRLERSASAVLGAGIDALGGVYGSLDATASHMMVGALSYTVDRDGRPLTLGVLATGRPNARARMPGLRVGGRLGRQWEMLAEADLTQPQVKAAWAAYRRSPLSPGALAAIGQALDANGRVDVRAYTVRTEQATVGAKVKAGVGFGAEVELAEEELRLVSADTRPPGGVWERNADCLDALHALNAR